MADEMLPTFRGARDSNGCPNDDCEASDTYLRVISVDELDRIFPQQSELSITPLPPQATHVCDSCGYVFSGMDNRLANVSEQTADERPTVDVSEYEWSGDVLDQSVMDAAVELVEGAPADATRGEVIEAVGRTIPGLGKRGAKDATEQADREFEEPKTSPAEYM